MNVSRTNPHGTTNPDPDLEGLHPSAMWAAARALRDQASELRLRGLYRAAAARRRKQLEVLLAIHVVEGTSTELLNMAASLRRSIGQHGLAWQACLQSLEMDGDPVSNRAAWTCKGALLREAGSFGEAVDVLESLLEKNRDDPFVLRALISACAALVEASGDQGVRDRAILYVTRLAAISKSQSDPLNTLRELKERASSPAEANGIDRLIQWLEVLSESGST